VHNAIADDPRVRRQGAALASAGWKVLGVGTGVGRSYKPDWLDEQQAGPLDPVFSSASGLPADSSEEVKSLLSVRLRTFFAQIVEKAKLGMLAFRHVPPALCSSFAEKAYWKIIPNANDLMSLAERKRADVWIANDWNTLPIAVKLKQQFGGEILYDMHECAYDEGSQKFFWRVLRRPIVKKIEQLAFPHIAHVTTVSDGIAGRVQQVYGLSRRPTVVRNMPSYRPATVRPIGEEVRVLYHGIVAPGRGLEVCIQAVAQWPRNTTMSIRGPVKPGYLETLKNVAERAGVASRVSFLSPVPMTSLVPAAMEFDIGIFSLPSYSQHNQYALPNKLFEYIGAGLCVCVSDLPEMRGIVNQYDVGRVFASETPEGIASTISQLSAGDILRYKKNALEAAKELCWERESEIFLSVVSGLDTIDTQQSRSFLERR